MILLLILVGVLVGKERCVDLVLACAQHKFLLVQAHICGKDLVLLLTSGMLGLLPWEICGLDDS